VNHRQVPFSNIPIEGTVVLPRCASAIPIAVRDDGDVEMGPIAMLPEGASLQICGDGFDELTVRVRWAGQAYFVFRQDLRCARKPSGSEQASEQLYLDVMHRGA
jgi:hypothetical protein